MVLFLFCFHWKGCGFRMKAAGASVYGCRVLSVLLRVLNWKFYAWKEL